MKYLMMLIFAVLIFQGCVVKRTHSPEIDSIVIDMETLKPIPNVKVRDLKVVGISEKSDEITDTTKSVSTKDGCLNIPSIHEYNFTLIPTVGTHLIESDLLLTHPDYTVKYTYIETDSSTRHQNYIFALCKKSSRNCMGTKFLRVSYEGNWIFYYQDDIHEYQLKQNGVYSPELVEKYQNLEDQLRIEYHNIKFDKVQINKCIKPEE